MSGSLLDWFVENPELEDPERLLMKGLNRYGQYQALNRAGGAIMDKVLPDQDRELDREMKRLDIATKKRALGIQDSQDYDEARNSNAPLWAATTRHALQRIPELGFMAGSNALQPFLKTARSLGPYDSIPNIARRIASILG